MIIDNAAFDMTSAHRSNRRETYRMQSKSAVIQNTGDLFGTIGAVGEDEGSGSFFNVLNYSIEGKKTGPISKEEGITANLTIQFETLNYLFQMLFRERLNHMRGQIGLPTETSGAQLNGLRISSATETYTYEEAEETSFSTTGRVRTADGREIEFGIEMAMSRSFYAEYSQSFTSMEPTLMDPLVINLDGDVAGISDQKFFFDLDCDGTEDEIGSLTAGNGFLALDKNKDGTINDGSELFGAKTGEGFKELAEYDLDGNGWIDEADEIFDRLLVWTKDEHGHDRLFTLKEAGVGAICLSAMGTEFSLKDETNTTKAKIRSTGFFLHENGMPGMIQQLDLAM